MKCLLLYHIFIVLVLFFLRSKKIEMKKEKERDSKINGNFDFTFVKSFQKYLEDIFLKLVRTIYRKWNTYVHIHTGWLKKSL